MSTTTTIPDVTYTHTVEDIVGTDDHQDLTVVWSTMPRPCRCGAVVQLDDTTPPGIWDSTGGTFEVLADVQCHACGARIPIPARLYEGHLDGAELDDAMDSVAQDAAALYAEDVESIRDRLVDELRTVADALTARGVDPRHATTADLDALSDEVWVRRAGPTWPGVEIADGRLIAWDVSPDGQSPIEVTLDDLDR
jgi:hypothetical protein